ncbi:carboxylating nicotinate-nucleotide diphosphorylase [Phenylobacterium sp.]|uniref:carboxylating nicotinate-nucleotide diphosphorylase n=1 Tax=Phenylobacterium sp. TaxID=1871053 RepID=UPI002F407606
MIAPPPDILIAPVVRLALAEDLGRAGDVTAQACIDADAVLRARFVARKPGVVAGLDCARLAILELDPGAAFVFLAADGQAVAAGQAAAKVEANARALLSAERTALNLLGRLSGVATLTRAYVDAVAGTQARIADTRKTTPGLRHLEKYAVRCGGGVNHRFGLDDAILIKDNHIAVAGGIRPVLQRAKSAAGHLVKIEIEVDTLEQLATVLEVGLADAVLLDNMSPATMTQAVAMVAGRMTIEASGGITHASAAAISESGVDYLSSGAITHSSPNLDVGLDIEI